MISSSWLLIGTLMQNRKSANIFIVTWKQNVEDLTLKHLLPSEIYARQICKNFYEHLETMEYDNN